MVRACILSDLSPAACHIAYNYNTPVDVVALKREFERIKAAVKEEFDWLYGTEHYEPAVGLYNPANFDVARRRLKNLASNSSKHTLLGGEDLTVAAIAWVTKARFAPCEKDGHPCRFWVRVAARFTLY